MKKGFTLIELLAVIVILAIIALIATPIILNIISSSKEESKLRSAENYITAVEQAVANKNLKGEFTPDKCVSKITSKELTCSYKDVEYTDKLKVTVEGEIPASVELTFSLDGNGIPNGKVKKDSTLELKYDDKTITGSNNKLVEKPIPDPVSFATDSWETIVKAFKSGSYEGIYAVGNTKEIDMGDLGTHTVRIANLSRPDECDTDGYSQTACGVVIEFVDIITTHNMNSTATNVGGYPASEMRTYLNNDVYNAIQNTTLKKAIKETTVVSSHGKNSLNTNRTDGNWTSTDKIYLLSMTEVYGIKAKTNTFISANSYSTDTSYTVTHQLDYYNEQGVTTENFSGLIKKLNGTAKLWWLRSSDSTNDTSFFGVYYDGDWAYGDLSKATNNYAISPAFRLATK